MSCKRRCDRSQDAFAWGPSHFINPGYVVIPSEVHGSCIGSFKVALRNGEPGLARSAGWLRLGLRCAPFRMTNGRDDTESLTRA